MNIKNPTGKEIVDRYSEISKSFINPRVEPAEINLKNFMHVVFMTVKKMISQEDYNTIVKTFFNSFSGNWNIFFQTDRENWPQDKTVLSLFIGCTPIGGPDYSTPIIKLFSGGAFDYRPQSINPINFLTKKCFNDEILTMAIKIILAYKFNFKF